MKTNRSTWPPLLLAGCLLITFVAIFLPRQRNLSSRQPDAASHAGTGTAAGPISAERASLPKRRPDTASAPKATAEEIVARKAAHYARSRREVLNAMARKRNIAVPADVQRFFDAAEAGNWEQVDALFKSFVTQRETQPHPPELDELWAPILAAYNGLEQVHLWPAQKYLDYGNSILDSLRPGMVYVGGTDPGRGIPELLNATGDGENHIVITQNGLADAGYRDYLNTLYGDRFNLPTDDEARQAFADYVADYQKRLAHDQQFPDEPKQVQPGEQVGPADGSPGWTAGVKSSDQPFQISGQISVMAVNERILQMILEKNPDMAFGLEESFALKSTYGDAAPLGPIMELRAAQDGQNALNADSAAQSIAYWQNAAQQLLSDPDATGSTAAMMAYAKLLDSQANLFTAHGLNDAAEQAYRLSLQLCPYSPESVFRYVNLLTGQNRMQDALAVAQAAVQADPKNTQFQNLATRLQNVAGVTADQ